MGEVVIPDEEMPEGWRDTSPCSHTARSALFKSHPLDRSSTWGEGDPDSTGPEHAAPRRADPSPSPPRSGLDTDGQFELAAIVDQGIIGYAMRTHHGADAKDKGHFDAMLTST